MLSSLVLAEQWRRGTEVQGMTSFTEPGCVQMSVHLLGAVAAAEELLLMASRESLLPPHLFWVTIFCRFSADVFHSQNADLSTFRWLEKVFFHKLSWGGIFFCSKIMGNLKNKYPFSHMKQGKWFLWANSTEQPTLTLPTCDPKHSSAVL